MSDNLLSPRQAADRLGVTTRTLRRYVEAGKLTPADRTPGGHSRFDPAALDALKPPTTPAP
jgi:excisionase family DNA binding protein